MNCIFEILKCGSYNLQVLKTCPQMTALDPLTHMTPLFLLMAATLSSAQTIGALYTLAVGGDPYNNETF